MKTKKMVLALTLVLFSMSLCVPFVNGQSPQKTRRPGFQNQTRPLIEILDLSDEQQEELKKLREAQQELQDQFREKARNFREELRKYQEDPENNRIQIENLQDELFNLRLEQMKSQYAHRKEIKKVFTEEQLEKISQIRRLQMQRRQAINRSSFGQRRMRGYYRGPRRDGSMRSPVWRRRR